MVKTPLVYGTTYLVLVWSVSTYTVYTRVFALRWTRGSELEPLAIMSHPSTQVPRGWTRGPELEPLATLLHPVAAGVWGVYPQ